MSIEVRRGLSDAELEIEGVRSWPIWTHAPATFPWTYDDRETCYLLEGEVTVTPDGGEPVFIRAGDLVAFPTGMSCRWQITQAVRKHYRFG